MSQKQFLVMLPAYLYLVGHVKGQTHVHNYFFSAGNGVKDEDRKRKVNRSFSFLFTIRYSFHIEKKETEYVGCS